MMNAYFYIFVCESVIEIHGRVELLGQRAYVCGFARYAEFSFIVSCSVMSYCFADSMGCSLPGSSIHGRLQKAKTTESRVTISFSRDLPHSGTKCVSPCYRVAGRFFTV